MAFTLPLLVVLFWTVPSSVAEAQSTRYDIENSLQFNSASSRYMTKNFWTVGSTTKWTFSTWVKRDSVTSAYQGLLDAGVDTNNRGGVYFEITTNKLGIYNYVAGSFTLDKRTTASYTSTSAWYHVVVAVDTAQATAANRTRLYVDGTEVTSFSTDTNIAQNAVTWITDNNNNSGSNVTHHIGATTANGFYFDGLMADVILVDGQQLTPSAFGYDDGGTWRPKDFAATTTTANNPYGTNGFRLDFASSTKLGRDRSGRGNDFTLNNITSSQQSATTSQPTTRFGAASSTPSGETFITGDVFFATSTSIAYSISKGAGSFVIDHVLDPLNKLLYHSFVESPDMKNLYDGVADLDEKGNATIELPKYLLALNKDFRYLGSPMGEAMPDLHVSAEVKKKWFGLFGVPVFRIAGGVPNGKISWQITGIRRDPFAQKNPIRVEVEKGPEELVDKGEYLHPELYE